MYRQVPKYILDKLKGEPVDFIIQSKHDLAKRTTGRIILVFVLLFSWIALFPFFFLFPLFEIYFIGSTRITVNGVSQTYTPANPWMPIMFAIFPMIISISSIVPWVIFLIYGIKLVKKKGAWYAGTNNSLIEFDDQKITYYSWNEFENTLKTTTHRDNTLDIILSFKKVLTEQQVASISKTGVANINALSALNQFKFIKQNIGLLGLTNGELIQNMIRHNMERFKESTNNSNNLPAAPQI